MAVKKDNAATPKETSAAPKRGRAAKAVDTVRTRTQSAYEAARDRSSEVTSQLAVYPLAAVIGGIAIGALAAALLPRTQRETKLLGKAGHRLVDAGREAVRKGIDAGRAHGDEITGKVVRVVGEAVGRKG